MSSPNHSEKMLWRRPATLPEAAGHQPKMTSDRPTEDRIQGARRGCGRGAMAGCNRTCRKRRTGRCRHYHSTIRYLMSVDGETPKDQRGKRQAARQGSNHQRYRHLHHRTASEMIQTLLRSPIVGRNAHRCAPRINHRHGISRCATRHLLSCELAALGAPTEFA
jgi:hypothetical protein